MLTYYPREYEDRRNIDRFKDLYNENTAQVIGLAISDVKSIKLKGKMTIQKVVFEIERTEK